MNGKTTCRTELAERLIELRKAKGLNSRQAAEAIGIDYQNYRKYETIAFPKEENYIKIADFYDVTIDYLMGRKTDHKVIKAFDDKVINPGDGFVGKESFVLHQHAPEIKFVENDLGKLTTLEIMILQKFRKISSEDKNDVARYVNSKKDEV